MKRVESKYFLFLVIHVPELIRGLSRFKSSKLAEMLERAGPVLLFGPILGRKFARLDIYGVVGTVLLSLLMVGGPVVQIFTLLLGLLGSALSLLGLSAANIVWSYLSGTHPMPGIGPLIPGIQVGPYYLPFVEGWLSILLIFLIHEGAHGIIALRRGIPLTDAGLVLFTVVPIAAYVMPEEETFKGSDPLDKVSVLSAGPAANVMIFIPTTLLLLLLVPLSTPLFQYVQKTYGEGVRILSVPDEVEINGTVLPSLVKGKMKPGDIIIAVNGEKVYTVYDIKNSLMRSKGDKIVLLVKGREGLREVIVPNKGYIGVKGGETAWKQPPPLYYHALQFLLSFLAVFSIINLMVAVVNALPFLLLDGGQAIEELKRVGGPNLSPLKALALLLLVINALPWFI